MNLENNEQNLKDNDLGFSTKPTHGRMVDKSGVYNVKRIGITSWHPYQTLVETSWLKFSAITLLYYICLNGIFALLILCLGQNALSGEHHTDFLGNFNKAFFFCVQTSTTVGYGGVIPITLMSNIVSSILALIGLLTFALATGLFFARFSKPVAKIIYSEKALIAPYQGGDSLQVRIVNASKSQLMDLEAQISCSWIEEINGIERRRFQALLLERHKIFVFPLNWNLVHPISEGSPIYNKSYEELKKMSIEFIVFIKGFDVVFNQTIHSGSSYTVDELVWNATFAPMYEASSDEGIVLDLGKINDINRLK